MIGLSLVLSFVRLLVLALWFQRVDWTWRVFVSFAKRTKKGGTMWHLPLITVMSLLHLDLSLCGSDFFWLNEFVLLPLAVHVCFESFLSILAVLIMMVFNFNCKRQGVSPACNCCCSAVPTSTQMNWTLLSTAWGRSLDSYLASHVLLVLVKLMENQDEGTTTINTF